MMGNGCCEKFGVFSRFLLFGCCGAGIALQVLAGLTCDFVTYRLVNDSTSDTNNNNTGTIGMLEQRTMGTDECVIYEYTKGGSYITSARTALVVALSGAVIATFFVLFEVLLCRLCCARFLEGLAFSIAMTSSGIVYTIFGSPNCNDEIFTCTWGEGASYNIVALFCYIVAMILNCCTPKPKPLLRKICCGEREHKDDGNGNKKKKDDEKDDMENQGNENSYEPYNPQKDSDPSIYTTSELQPTQDGPGYAQPY